MPTWQRAEKQRKERRRAEESARAEAASALNSALGGEDVDAISALLEKAVQLGCDDTAIGGARARLDELRREANDPEVARRKERERRAKAAEARMAALEKARTGGHVGVAAVLERRQQYEADQRPD